MNDFAYFCRPNNRTIDFFHWKNPWIAAQYQIPIQSISKWMKLKGSHVLDWGCGTGHFSLFLAEQKAQVSAYSINPLEPNKSTEGPLIRIVMGDPADPVKIPLLAASFDAVFSVGVLEHVTESGGTEIESMNEIYRILRPGGYFFVFHLPNKISWIEWAIRFFNRMFQLNKFCHQNLYDFRAVRDLASQAGFVIRQQRLYNFLPRNFSARLPRCVANNLLFIYGMNVIEKTFSVVLRPFCQNHLVVMQKPEKN